MLILIPFMFMYIAGAKGAVRNVAFVAVLLFDIMSQNTAGWVCTTMTYVWPVFFAAFAMCMMRKIYQQEGRWYHYVLFYVSYVTAINHEMLCMLMTCVLAALVIGYYHTNYKVFITGVIGFVLSVAEMLFVLDAPGNAGRVSNETAVWFPGYENLSAIDKVFLGINRAMHYFYLEDNRVFDLMLVMVLICAFLYSTSRLLKVVLATLAVGGVSGDQFWTVAVPDAVIYEVDWTKKKVYIILGVGVLLLLVISKVIIDTYKNENFTRMLLCLVLVWAGIGTTVAMGFLPTIYGSSSRTYTFTYFSLMMVSVYLAKSAEGRSSFVERHSIGCSQAFMCIVFLLGFMQLWTVYKLG